MDNRISVFLPQGAFAFSARICLCASALLFAPGLRAEVSSQGESNLPHILDEWQPIDRLIIATRFQEQRGLHVPSQLGLFAAAMANRQGIKVVIVTDEDEAAQGTLLNLLRRMTLQGDGKPVIARASDILFVGDPFPSEWARDYAPLVVFPDQDSGFLRGFHTRANLADSEASVASIGRELQNSFYTRIPPVRLGKEYAALRFQGGDWMTLDDGRSLVTTTAAILQHRRGDYGDQAVTAAVAASVKEFFGITHMHGLRPLIQHGHQYELSNAHVDLQVRTLPGKRIFVARVSRDDEQFEILENNARDLQSAGYDVLRIDNADITLPRESETGTRFFKSYTNALFLNHLVLIPAYGDALRDAEAKFAYEAALNDGISPTENRFVVVQIPTRYGAQAIEHSASIRCAAHELHVVPTPAQNTAIPSFESMTLR